MEKEWEYDGDAVGLLAAVIRCIVETELEKDGVWDSDAVLSDVSALSGMVKTYGIRYEKVAKAMIDAGLDILERLSGGKNELP